MWCLPIRLLFIQVAFCSGLLATTGRAATAKPSIAVFSLEADLGVATGLAKLLSDQVTLTVRKSEAFSRVVSAREIDALIGFERQKQLVACDSQSCMAEVAGSLGVDFILVGSVARVGKSYVLNMKVLDVRRAVQTAAVFERQDGESEEVLLDRTYPAVRQLLTEAGFAHTMPVTPAKDGAYGSGAGEPGTTASPARWPLPVAGTGGAVAVVGGLALLAGMATTLLTSAALLIYPKTSAFRFQFFPWENPAVGQTRLVFTLALLPLGVVVGSAGLLLALAGGLMAVAGLGAFVALGRE